MQSIARFWKFLESMKRQNDFFVRRKSATRLETAKLMPTIVAMLLACEQAPVGDSRVQSSANGMNR